MLLARQKVFSTTKWDIGHCKVLPFNFNLKPGARPTSQRAYSPQMTALVRMEIDKLLAAGIIRPSMSEWASPVVAVMKPDGTARITVNYRRLNSMTAIPQIPLPIIEDILNGLGGARYFTAVDITSGYFTCAIEAESIPMTAMVTTFGLFEWTRCPQGAAGAPAHFTRLMGIVLNGLERVVNFIDDVLIYSSTLEQHVEDLGAVLQRLEEHDMRLAPKKVYLGVQRVRVLGHIVTPEGIKPDPDKVKALRDMPEPTDLSTLRSWLGLANYYRRFVRGMAKVVSPLTALTVQGAEFNITEDCRAAMRKVQHTLADHALMRYPDYEAAASGERPFILATDACKAGFGAVLSQLDVALVEQPIAFASRSTLRHEKNWSTTDLEAAAIVYGVRKFRHLLWGCRFTIHTDHRALQWLVSSYSTLHV
jgi:hypothetical protein